MPKVMPVAIRDETGAFIRQMAQGNEALAQLYTRLLAQYEERRMNEAHQREMMSMREGITQDRIGAQNEEWYNRERFRHGLRNPGDAPQGPNYLGPGGGGVPNPASPTTPPAAPTSAAPAARPSVYTIDQNPFRSGAGTGTPAAPAPQAMSGEAANAFAQAPRGADHTDFSAQSRKPLPTVEQPPKPPKRETPPNTQLPAQPRVSPKVAATRPQGKFLDIDQRWLDLMHQKEDEFRLPRGTMMTTYGLENGGGRQFGRNPKSKNPNPPEGIFQFSKDLRDTYKLTDRDIYDPAKMIHWAAYNMRRNADILEANHKVKLPLTPEAIPMFYALHQWGEGAGPRIVAAYLQNPEQPMASNNVMGTQKDRNGNVLSNYTILSANGHEPTITVGAALRNKAVPWYAAYTQQFTEHAHQPQGKYVSTPAPPPQQAPQQPQGGDPNAPRPPGAIPPQQHGTMGSDARLVRAVRGGAELALPEGYTLRQTSGARPGGRSGSHHHRGNAGDFQIFKPDGTPIANRGPDTTGLYTQLARGVKAWIRENDPEAERRMGWGGAFETRRGSGLADLMHFDWGGSRGRLRPEAQFANLQPLGANERVARAPQQPQQPVKVAGAVPTQEAPTAPQTPPLPPAISRIPTSPEVAATFDNKIATAGFDRRTPDAAATLGPPPVKAGTGTLAARSDLEYGLPPEQQAANLPLPRERPEIPVDVVPQTSTLQARSDLDYNTPQSKTVTWGDDLKPAAGIAGATPPQEFTQAERSDAPVQLNNDIFTTQAPPTMPPRLDAGVVPKDALPAEFTSAAPGQATPDPMLDVPDTATPRAPLPPGFNVPWPPLDGGSTIAAANAPSGQMPQDMKLPTQLPPPLPPEAPPQSTSAPTMRGMIDAIRSGNIPSLSTAPDVDPNAPKQISPIQLNDVRKAIYGGGYAGTPRGIREAREGRLPQAEPPTTPDERQDEFNKAMQEYVREKLGGEPIDVAKDAILQGARTMGMAVHDATPKVIDWIMQKAREYSQSSPSPPPKQHQSQHPSAPAPIRTTPDGRPYIPQGEPLKVQPPKGAPTNTTLSTGPTQGGTAIPPAPGQKVNPLTGRPDLPQPVVQPDGTVLYPEPGEVVEQQ